MAAPLVRTAWTDDDGSGNTGTVINNAEKTTLYNQIDEALTDVLSSTATGTQNNFALGAGGDNVIRWSGASDVVFTGFTNGAAGRSFIIENAAAGSQTLRVTNDDTNSTAGNRVLCESTNGQIIGPRGRGLAVYDSTSSRWRYTAIDPGAPITPTFSAGDFTANGSMTWTVDSADVVTYAYIQHGKMLTVMFSIATTDVGGTPSTALRIASPGGFAATKTVLNAIVYQDAGGTPTLGYMQISATGTLIELFKDTAANWTSTSGDNTAVHGEIIYEVN